MNGDKDHDDDNDDVDDDEEENDGDDDRHADHYAGHDFPGIWSYAVIKSLLWVNLKFILS